MRRFGATAARSSRSDPKRQQMQFSAENYLRLNTINAGHSSLRTQLLVLASVRGGVAQVHHVTQFSAENWSIVAQNSACRGPVVVCRT